MSVERDESPIIIRYLSLIRLVIVGFLLLVIVYITAKFTVALSIVLTIVCTVFITFILYKLESYHWNYWRNLP